LPVARPIKIQSVEITGLFSGLFLAQSWGMQVVSHFSPLAAPARLAVAPRPQAEAVAVQPLKADVQPLKAEVEKPTGIWETESFSFWDVVDAINPLQHIPVISTIYRKLTGDEMGYASRIAGDTLYSGIFGSLLSGLASAVVNVFVDATTGKDIGEHMMAAVEPQPVPAATRQHAAIPPSVIEHNSALLSESLQQEAMPSDHAAVDSSRTLAAIEQYKWQLLDDEEKPQSNHWV
jgi:hypothetical protein